MVAEAKPKPESPEESAMKSLRKIIVKKQGGSIDDHAAKVLSEVKRHPKLHSVLAPMAMARFVREIIAGVKHVAVSTAKFNPSNCTRGLDAVASTSGTAMRSLLDWRMADGRKLSEMLGKELDPMIETESQLANGHAMNSKFFALIREKVGDDEVIGKKLDAGTVNELWKSASGAGQTATDTHSDGARTAADADGHHDGDNHDRYAAASAAA